MITRKHLEKGITYSEYRTMWEQLVQEGKTTGADQSEKMIDYTKLNLQRSHRVEKTVILLPEIKGVLQSFPRKMYWVVLSEPWCGDAAQNLPVIAMMADAAPQIELRILLRDENLDVMDDFLTNGARAIPKLVCLDAATLDILGIWGPRPQVAQEMVMNYKKLPEPKEPYSEFTKQVQLWYAKDRGLNLQHEFLQLLVQWTNKKAA